MHPMGGSPCNISSAQEDSGVPYWTDGEVATALGEPVVESLDLIIKNYGSCEAKSHLQQEVCSLEAGGLRGPWSPLSQTADIPAGEGVWARLETMAGARVPSFRLSDGGTQTFGSQSS